MSATEQRTQLADEDMGTWLVTTASGSVYKFDLSTRTVERVGGERRQIVAPADTLQPLRNIIELRVGRPERWWMRNTSGGYVDLSDVWQCRQSSPPSVLKAPQLRRVIEVKAALLIRIAGFHDYSDTGGRSEGPT